MYEIEVVKEAPKLVAGMRKPGHYREIAKMLPALFDEYEAMLTDAPASSSSRRAAAESNAITEQVTQLSSCFRLRRARANRLPLVEVRGCGSASNLPLMCARIIGRHRYRTGCL